MRRGRLERLFIWLSGVDPTLLAQSSKGASERIKYAGLGSLVLIPAVFGFASMTYAVSTVVADPRVYFVAGAVWSGIVLAIDRYLVSTIYKSKLKLSRGRLVSILVRYVFAVVLGIAVSHPMLLLWFDGSIQQTLAESLNQRVAARREAAQVEIRAIPAGSAASAVAEKEKQLTCLRALQTAEQSDQRVSLPCGYSSGISTCGPRCNVISNQIGGVEREIAALAGRADRERAEVGDEKAQIQRVAEADVLRIRRSASDDYLARVNALSILEKNNAMVKYVTWFMILFFVFVDIMPVTMKVATPAGEVDARRDTQLLDALTEQDFERDVIKVVRSNKANIDAHADYRTEHQQIQALTGLATQVIGLQRESTAAVERTFAGMTSDAKNGPNGSVRRDRLDEVHGLRELFMESGKINRARFRAWLHAR